MPARYAASRQSLCKAYLSVLACRFWPYVSRHISQELDMDTTITHNDLVGQRALVTGATSGIGRAIALQLARDGAEVLVHGRDAARGADTVETIRHSGGKATFVAADLSDAAEVQRLANEVGDVDILINNAGIALFG